MTEVASGSDPRPAGVRREGDTWDDVLTMDIVSVIMAAGQSISEMAAEVAGDFRHDINRVKAAFNCQEPENATLSAERLAVEHAVSEAQAAAGGLFAACAAPSFDSDEIDLEGPSVFNGEDEVPMGRQTSHDKKPEKKKNKKEKRAKKGMQREDSRPVDQNDGESDEGSIVCAAESAPQQQAPVVADLLDFADEPAVSSSPTPAVSSTAVAATAAPAAAAEESLLDLGDNSSQVSFVAEEAAEREAAVEEVKQEQAAAEASNPLLTIDFSSSSEPATGASSGALLDLSAVEAPVTAAAPAAPAAAPEQLAEASKPAADGSELMLDFSSPAPAATAPVPTLAPPGQSAASASEVATAPAPAANAPASNDLLDLL